MKLAIIIVFFLLVGIVQADSYIDTDNYLVVNGEKIFPVGMYFLRTEHNGTSYSGDYPYRLGYQALKEGGFNVIISEDGPPISVRNWYPSLSFEQEEAEYALYKAEQHNLFILGANQPFFNMSYLPNVLDWAVNKDSFLGWYSVDEPIWADQRGNWHAPSLSELKTRVDVVRYFDPNHIIFTNFAPAHVTDNLTNYTQDIIDFLPYTDVAATSLHMRFDTGWSPCTEDGQWCILENPNITVYGDFVELFVNMTNDEKPVWMILDTSCDMFACDFSDNAPIGINFTQKRFIAYDVILSGGKGIMYWAWLLDVRADPIYNYWEDTQRIANEIDHLSEVLFEENLFKGEVDGVEYIVKEYMGNTYVIAVNSENEQKVVAMPIQNVVNGEYKVLFENRTTWVYEDNLYDIFEGYDVNVYELGDTLIDECNLNCVESSVDEIGYGCDEYEYYIVKQDDYIRNGEDLVRVLNFDNDLELISDYGYTNIKRLENELIGDGKITFLDTMDDKGYVCYEKDQCEGIVFYEGEGFEIFGRNFDVSVSLDSIELDVNGEVNTFEVGDSLNVKNIDLNLVSYLFGEKNRANFCIDYDINEMFDDFFYLNVSESYDVFGKDLEVVNLHEYNREVYFEIEGRDYVLKLGKAAIIEDMFIGVVDLFDDEYDIKIGVNYPVCEQNGLFFRDMYGQEFVTHCDNGLVRYKCDGYELVEEKINCNCVRNRCVRRLVSAVSFP